MEEKLKIFKVCIYQSFEYYWHRLFKKSISTEKYEDCYRAKYILAKNSEDAVIKYKDRYKYDYDYPIERYWYWNTNHGDPLKVKNIFCKVVALEEHITFEEMKRSLRAEELLAFCKQEMYPIEVLMK